MKESQGDFCRRVLEQKTWWQKLLLAVSALIAALGIIGGTIVKAIDIGLRAFKWGV